MTTDQLPNQPPDADHTQYYLRTLHELIDLGADLARLVHGQAKVEATMPVALDPPIDFVIQFERIARTIRRTIRLAQYIARPTLPSAPGTAHPIPPPAANDATATERAVARLETEAPAPEPRRAELLDRLDAPELPDDILARPLPRIIAHIRRDLDRAARPPKPRPHHRRILGPRPHPSPKAQPPRPPW